MPSAHPYISWKEQSARVKGCTRFTLQEYAELREMSMVEDARKNPRLIGGVYQVGQVITRGNTLTNYTAYNRNTNDVVGLFVFDLLPRIGPEAALRFLEPLERR